MIEQVSIANFKAIGPSGVDLRLAPLTIFVGPNGSGKSSVLEGWATKPANEKRERMALGSFTRAACSKSCTTFKSSSHHGNLHQTAVSRLNRLSSDPFESAKTQFFVPHAKCEPGSVRLLQTSFFCGHRAMMDPELLIPITANRSTVFFVFCGFLLVFDLVFVRWLKLSKVAWKQVDYIWLGLGMLGLFGTVAQIRMDSASAWLPMYKQRAEDAFNSVNSLAEQYAVNPGAICRTFVRSEYSPPPDEFQDGQNEYNTACAWIKQMSEALNSYNSSPLSVVRTSMPWRPKFSDGALNDMFRGLDQQFDYYDQSITAYVVLRDKSKRTSTEEGLVHFGPFLLAIALAIRIAKVTGEIKLES